MSRFVRPRPVALLFFIAAMATTVGLGTWQVQRLEWKSGLIAEIEAAKTQSPLTVLPHTKAELEAKEFYPVEVRGAWMGDTEFHITPRFFKGQLGYFLLTPLKLEDGRILLVNRGWIPAALKDLKSRPQTAISGEAEFLGLLRTGDERNGLTPENQPEKNIWFGRDTLAMAESAGLDNVVPAEVDIVGAQSMKHLPVPSDGSIRLRNDHLSYILTWYMIALGILAIFIIYHRKPR